MTECWVLQEQLQCSQEALRGAKAESARRLKSLQSLQQQVRPAGCSCTCAVQLMNIAKIMQFVLFPHFYNI